MVVKQNSGTVTCSTCCQLLIPARVALALQADGWILRNDIIWYASNKMPESVTNRCNCDAPVTSCVVLDPFVGSGTTPAAAISLGRRGIGIDLNERYLAEHAVPRIEAAIAAGRIQPKDKLNLVPIKPVVESIPL